MLTWLIKNRMTAFEKAYGHELSYAREILAADLRVRDDESSLSEPVRLERALARAYALGHGKTCQRVVVAGTTIPVVPTPLRPAQSEAVLA